MIVVIFELTPRGGAADRYFELAAALRAELEQIDGFVSVERFQSLTRPGTFVSISTWRDEDAVRRWREQSEHRAAQREGRARLFADYRLRVARVLRDYALDDRAEAPNGERAER